MDDERALPTYQSHKKVQAVLIGAIQTNDDGSAMIVPQETEFNPFPVDKAYVDKHQPQVGGYFVKYDDGYQSWSPAAAFEAGYTRL